MVLLCFAFYSLWDHGQMMIAAQLSHCSTRTSITWFVGKGEDCLWAASTSLHTAVSLSQAQPMPLVSVIPGAVCGQRAWRLELSGPCLRRQALSPSLAHPQFPWLSPPLLPASTTTSSTAASTLPSQQASTAPPTTVLTSALDIMSQGTPRPAKNAN